MTAHFTVKNHRGETVAKHHTPLLIVAAAMRVELEDRYPNHEINVKFKAA